MAARSSKKGWFSSAKETDVEKLARLEGQAVAGITELIGAILKFLKMNAKGFLTGLITIRRAFKILGSCKKDFNEWEEGGKRHGKILPSAECISGACNYGYGLLNVVLGSLPPRILTLVGFLGMKVVHAFNRPTLSDAKLLMH